MDSLITAAARALAGGDPLGALNRVALRNDPPALALRGLAMAQLEDFGRARALLRDAARGFGPRAAVARARCVVAQAEIALVGRDFGPSTHHPLVAARALLDAHGDRANAIHAGLIEARRALLCGRLADAARIQSDVAARIRSSSRAGADPIPAATIAVSELVAAGIASRQLRAGEAHAALARAAVAARSAGVPALRAEVEQASHSLAAPAARLIAGGRERPVRLDEVESLFESASVIVDGCRHAVRERGLSVMLATRPILFALVRRLAAAWPCDVARAELIAEAFRTRHGDDSHRARLRVELGRLRVLLAPIARIRATHRGYALVTERDVPVVVLAQPIDGPHAALLALLADGQSWSSAALALAVGASQRSVQRALERLAAQGRVQAIGQARARRWMTPPLAGFATTLLLPAAPPLG